MGSSKTWTKNAAKDYQGVNDPVYAEIKEAWQNISKDNILMDASLRGKFAESQHLVCDNLFSGL